MGIARKLTEAGYRAIAVARQKSDQLAFAIKQAEHSRPGSLQFVPFDLNETDAIPDLVRGMRRKFGPIHGLVNNAALGLHGALADRYDVPHVPYTLILRPDGTADRVFDGDEASEDDLAAGLRAAAAK